VLDVERSSVPDYGFSLNALIFYCSFFLQFFMLLYNAIIYLVEWRALKPSPEAMGKLGARSRGGIESENKPI